MGLLYFILMIGPLVFFHELGHFVAARWFGVKCERFAIGFGPPFASFRRGDTEFSVRAFPLGGYVSMLGMHPDEEIAEKDRGRALTDKPIWQRMLVYLAGPAMNVLIAAPIFMAYFGAQPDRAGSEIGFVLDGSPAMEAGLRAGDQVVEINGRRIRYFDQIRRIASSSPGEDLAIVVERGGTRVTVHATPEPVRVPEPLVRLRTVEVGQLGVVWSRYGSFVAVDAGSDAEAAGVRTFDRVAAVDGVPVETWLELEEILRARAGEVELTLVRPNPTGDQFAVLFTQSPIVVDVTLPAGGAAAFGLRAAQASVFDVAPGSPAAEAGLRAGDRIVRLGDRPASDVSIVAQRIASEPEQVHTLEVVRGTERFEVTLQPRTMTVVGDFRSEVETTFVGFRALPRSMVAHELAHMGAGERIAYSIGGGIRLTFEYLIGIFLGVVYLVIGAVDSSNLGGPMMIADVANRAGSAGLLVFLRFMAIISINLGIVNLLPLPGLDGGQLMLLTAEGVKRRPLSLRARQVANYVGIVCIVLLMLVAFKNDVERYWQDFANWLNS